MTKTTQQWKSAQELLTYLNTSYAKIHTTFEDLFWTSFMGDPSVNDKKNKADQARTNFRSNEQLNSSVNEWLQKSTGETKQRLMHWQMFFSRYQVPAKAKALKEKIMGLETKIEKFHNTRKQGYIDPVTKKFVKATTNSMRALMVTHEKESVRKACFNAMNVLAKDNAKHYVTLVGLRNDFARTIGYEDFYAYKLMNEEGMTKKELFDLFDSIYNKTQYAFKDIRELEKTRPGLRKPWNFSFMMRGSFTKEDDAYCPFENVVERWGRSFAALGINYQGSSIVFDLLDREGKYNNGFCHWPEIIQFKNGKRIPGRAQLTCNVVLGIPGEAEQGLHTLFHECGHAAHLLNAEMKDVCVNNEYPPASTAWDETQSMFLDTVGSSIEWLTRYAKNKNGEAYPFELFERKVRAMHVVQPLALMGVMNVCNFEKAIYENKKLTPAAVIATAYKTSKKFSDRTVDNAMLLEVPHIYAWDNACSYQGYGLAELALSQWREYFFKKYGYIVDNPNVGKEMKKVWQYGSSMPFAEIVKLATGKKLSSTPYITAITRSIPATLKIAKERIATLAKKPLSNKSVNLDAHISIVHGKKHIADNKKSFEVMTETYSKWLATQK